MESKNKKATRTEIDRIADGYQERNSLKKKNNILKNFKSSKDASSKTTISKKTNETRKRKLSKKASKSSMNVDNGEGNTAQQKALYEKLSNAFQELVDSKKSEMDEKNEDNLINVYKKLFAEVCDNQIQGEGGDIKEDISLNDKTISHNQYALLGSIKLNLKGIKFSSQQKPASVYEATLHYGRQKWRIQGTATSTNDATFNKNEIILHPLVNHTLALKITEVKILRRVNVSEQLCYNISNLIHFNPKESAINMNDKGNVTLIITASWIPFELDKLSSLHSSCSEKETKFEDQTDSNQFTIRRNEDKALSTPTTSPGGDIDPLLTGHGKEEEAFYARMNEYAAVAALMEAENSEKDEEHENQCKEEAQAILEELIPLVETVNEVLDDYRGRYVELQLLEETVYQIRDHLQTVCKNYDAFCHCNENYQNFGQHWVQERDISDFEYYGIAMVDETIVPHLKIVLRRIKEVGKFGPLKVAELYALDCIEKQGNALKRLMDMQGNKNIRLEDIPELAKRRILLELWRSSCDGSTFLCLNAKILCLELQSEFGRDVRRQHPDVAEQLFPELVRRILGQEDVVNLKDCNVTVFQFVQFLEEMEANEEIGDLSKVVDKLALEMFLTTMLQSENRDLVLAAVTRVGSLLALRTSNLCALTHLVLSKDETLRAAAVKHITEIASDAALHDKAFISLVELLESRSKRDRQCSCCALGLLGAKECIPQLAYLCHSDEQFDVRQAAGHALLAFGEEGELAFEHATCTLLTQTMTHKVSLKGNMRMGTAL